MRKNDKSRQKEHIEATRAEERKIISQIMEQINKKRTFSDSQIQEYEEKLSKTLDELVEQFDEKCEFNLEMLSFPHEYAQRIQKGEHDFLDEKEVWERRIIGDAECEEENYVTHTNFSLEDIQIIVTEQTRYNGKVRSFDFRRTGIKMKTYNILVYIPKKIEEMENQVKTYQELVQQEKRQEMESQIKQNEQETVEKIMLTIDKKNQLLDFSNDVIEEYRKKIQEAVKLSKSQIEYLVRKGFWNDKTDRIKIKTVTDPYEYNEAIDKSELRNLKLDSIIGDFKTDTQEDKKSDFSIGNMQVCSKTYEGEGSFYKEILLYIPQKEFCEKQLKRGIKTYQELLNKDKQEKDEKINKTAKSYRNQLSKYLELETNKRLTQEQIESILDQINFKFRAEYYDYDRLEDDITITSVPDKFARYLLEDEHYWINTIIGDNSKRRKTL